MQMKLMIVNETNREVGGGCLEFPAEQVMPHEEVLHPVVLLPRPDPHRKLPVLAQVESKLDKHPATGTARLKGRLV